MAGRTQPRAISNSKAKDAWDLRLRIFGAAISLLTLLGAGFNYVIKPRMEEKAARIKICDELSKTAATIAAATTKEEAAAAMKLYIVVYLNAHTHDLPDAVVTAKQDFKHEVTKIIETEPLQSQAIIDRSHTLSKSCQVAANRLWF